MVIDKNTDLVIFDHKDILEILYNDNSAVLNSILGSDSDEEIKNYNNTADRFYYNKINTFTENNNLTQKNIDQVFQSEWLMPNEYYKINLLDFLLEKCTNHIEIERCKFELSIFEKQNLENLLRYMIYLKAIANENQIILGVGRGSSVASFILFLIGIHKVNPIIYNLDFNEFLK